jgi:ATP/ADP translocase
MGMIRIQKLPVQTIVPTETIQIYIYTKITNTFTQALSLYSVIGDFFMILRLFKDVVFK